MIAGFAQCKNYQRLGSMPRTGGQPTHAAFQIRQPLFKDIAGRVHNAGVDISRLFQRKQAGSVIGVTKSISRCLVNRHRPRSGGGVGLLAGVVASLFRLTLCGAESLRTGLPQTVEDF